MTRHSLSQGLFPASTGFFGAIPAPQRPSDLSPQTNPDTALSSKVAGSSIWTVGSCYFNPTPTSAAKISRTGILHRHNSQLDSAGWFEARLEVQLAAGRDLRKSRSLETSFSCLGKHHRHCFERQEAKSETKTELSVSEAQWQTCPLTARSRPCHLARCTYRRSTRG